MIYMQSISATALKNRLGEALAQAAIAPVAVKRHGRVVALLVPPAAKKYPSVQTRARSRSPRWDRRADERIVALCAQADFRPSRWLRAGNAHTLSGIAVMLASHPAFNRTRMLALAERLQAGISDPAVFGRWLERSPVQAARLFPMLESRLRKTAGVSR